MAKKNSVEQSSKWLTDGVQNHQKGDLAKAKSLYKKILKNTPVSPEIHYLLGLLYLQQSNHKSSLKHHKQAWQQNKTVIKYINSLADAYLNNEMNSFFVKLLEDTVRSNLADDVTLFKLANYFVSKLEYDEAELYFQQTIQANPQNWQAYLGIGNCCFQRDQLKQALEYYNHALQLYPGQVDALNNIGAILLKKTQYTKALEVFEKVIAVVPGNVLALSNIASVYLQKQDYQKTISYCEKVFAIDSNHIDGKLICAKAYADSGNVQLSLVVYESLLNLGIQSAYLYNCIGNLFDKTHDYQQANRFFRLAIESEPEFADGYYNLGISEIHAKNFAAAVQYLLKALQINTQYYKAKAPLLHCYRQCCLWDEAAVIANQVRQLLLDGVEVEIPPFSIITLEDSDSVEQKAVAHHWITNHIEAKLIESAQKERSNKSQGITFSTDRRLRLGYLSSDFHEHATAHLLVRILELHDTEKFEVFAYSYGPDDQSVMRNRLVDSTEHFVDVQNLAIGAMADLIKSDNLDILIDLKGFTQNTRSEVLAYRLAPIQINYLGYPATMGNQLVDYVLTDRFVTPENSEQFEEQILYLPDCYQPNDNTRLRKASPSRSALNIPEQAVVLGAFHQSYKITKQILNCWCDILKAAPNSILWCLSTNQKAQHQITLYCETKGIDLSRLVFAERCDSSTHLSRIQQVDIMLDTFPVNGHTSTSDALWAGVPVVSCAGETFISRVAGSLLHNMNLDELICANLIEYSETVIRLATDSEALKKLKIKTKRQRELSPLFNSEGYTRNLERILLVLVQQ